MNRQTSTNQTSKIKIAVSSCLLGLPVRYDGQHKLNSTIKILCESFECISICPECEIGLGVPRPPVNLVQINHAYRAVGVENTALDVTQALQQHATDIASKHKDICGYIFKARSPSCGVNSTPWFDESGQGKGFTNGIFSAGIQELLPTLPVTEETQLENAAQIDDFISRVKEYAENIKKANS